ncbi:AAA family ATPase [Alloiococcus sp. CFN-8]|uniref:AAA family ATPase n=1 Tax=Alloiococcus sp. CFN-8 TaxID=3416081 RepID=UPI003CEC44C7
MIIKGLKIKAFGGLKDKELELKSGMNVIYGENERGKSTLQTFIKVMLYGFSSSRSKDIKNNDRLKYSPWNGERPAGELHVSHEDREIIIQRTFGNTKKEDNIAVLDSLTGKKLEEYRNYSPGDYLLELSGEAFEKTLSIKQLNTYIASSKDDDLLQRIANLRSSGEESVSIHKALQELQYEKKLIRNNRKAGKLDAAENKLSKLYEEYHKTLRLSEENIESKDKLNRLLDKREEIRKELADLELYKKYLKKSKLHKEYKEIVEYLKKSESLEEEKNQAEEFLSTSQGMVDELFLNSLEEELGSCERAREAVLEKQLELQNKKEIFEEKEQLIGNNFRGYLEEDYKEEEILKLMAGHKADEYKLKEQENTLKELAALKNELSAYEKAYEPFITTPEGFEEGRLLLQNYEEKLLELKSSLEANSLGKGSTSKDRLNNKIIIAVSLAIIGLLLIFGAFKLNVSFRLPLLLLGIIAVMSCGYIFYTSYSLLKDVKDLKDKTLRQEALKKSIHDIEEKLVALMERLKFSSLEELLMGIKRYSLLAKNVEVIRIKIQDREDKLISPEYREIRESFQYTDKAIKDILNNSEAESLEDFLLRLKEYKAIALEVKLLQREILSLEKDIEKLWDSYKNKEEQLRRRVTPLGLKDVPIDRLTIELGRLKEKYKKFKEVEGELKAINNTYSALLKERDIDSIMEEISDLDIESHEEIYSTEDEIDEKIKLLNESFLNNAKEIKDTENLLDNLFKGVEPLWKIEEELELTKEEIALLNRRLKVLDIAIFNLQESYNMVQKSYAPTINREVGELLARITGNKYQEVKVSEEYALTLRDNEMDTLFNGDFLSSGTFDQAYLALRIAMIMLIFPDKELPIILDDAFVQYDDERLKSTLSVLQEIAKKKQVIIFTCQKREVDYLKDKGINLINL